MYYSQLFNLDSALLDNYFQWYVSIIRIFSGYPVFAFLSKLSQQQCIDLYTNISFHFLLSCMPAIALQILMHGQPYNHMNISSNTQMYWL
jgi:hypothetical protein